MVFVIRKKRWQEEVAGLMLVMKSRILVRIAEVGLHTFPCFLPKCCNPFYHSCYAFTYPSAVV